MINKSNIKWNHLFPSLEKEKYVVKENRLENVQAHDHTFLELSYILEGNVKHTRDGKTAILSKGDYLIVDFGSIHSFEVKKGESFVNLDCMFLPELLDPVLIKTESLKNLFEHYLLHFNMKALSQNPAAMVFHDDDGKVLSVLRQIQEESEKRQPGYTEMIRCCLVRILLMSIRKIDDAAVAATQNDITSYLSAYVAAHYMEEISLGKLAQKLNYTMPYGSKKFKADMGVSFVEYLQNYRVMQACRLLMSSKKTVADIADSVGYRDVKFFVSVFKRNTGFSPATFRRNNKKQ